VRRRQFFHRLRGDSKACVRVCVCECVRRSWGRLPPHVSGRPTGRRASTRSMVRSRQPLKIYRVPPPQRKGLADGSRRRANKITRARATRLRQDGLAATAVSPCGGREPLGRTGRCWPRKPAALRSPPGGAREQKKKAFEREVSNVTTSRIR